MKKTILTIAVVLFGLTFVLAGNIGDDPPVPNKVLQNKISNIIEYPDFALEDKIECSVFAVIKVEENGEISVLRCDSQRCQMRDYVKEELKKIQLIDENVEKGKKYLLRVDFKIMK